VIPGKTYRPEDFLTIAWRRRWLIVLPLVVIALGTFIWTQGLADRYQSEAVVLIVPPRVPENYVRQPVTETMQERLEGMRHQILNRARLEHIIVEFDLYPELRRRHLMDEVVAQMRRDIGIEVPRTARRVEPTYFRVRFEADHPRTAMAVAERLASLFVRYNIEDRATLADTTTNFLASQLDDARKKLQENEARLEAFKRANAGHLPSEVDTNLHLLQATQQQMQTLVTEINQARERQITIERTIADENAIELAAPPPPVDGQPTNLTAAQQLEHAKKALAALQLRLRPDHPDVRRGRRQIQELEARAAAEALAQPVSGAPPALTQSPAQAARQKRISALRTEFEGLDRRMAANRGQIERLQQAVETYKGRIAAAPGVESQLTQLTRDYSTIENTYKALLLKSQDAKVAANLEQQQVGESFKIVDPARMPERPSSPDRFRLNALGILAGLLTGVALVALLEYRDSTLRTEDDVLVALSLPVVALVPTMMTAGDLRAVRRRRVAMAAALAVTVMIGTAVMIWKVRPFEGWIN
jgi:polysaccharide chain length determinant protein (PEP-CTERM system associated)